MLPLSSTAQTLIDQCRSVEANERRSGGFEFGHIDNPYGAPIVAREFTGVILGGHDEQPRESALVQVRGEGTKKPTIRLRTDRSGTFRVRHLPPGPYFFVSVARGFQSVSGCVVIDRKAGKGSPVVIRLPLGV
jgi:hypothetical protein